MRASVEQNWIPFNKPLEGVVNYMYLDVKGLLTTGMGNLIDATQLGDNDPPRLPTAQERTASLVQARRYDWRRNSDGAAASQAEVDAEWDHIRAMISDAPKGGGFFASKGSLHLEPAEIQRIITEKLNDNERALKLQSNFQDFDNWPADAQLGLHSMAWAMGTEKLKSFPKFGGFVKNKQWAQAAPESHFTPDIGTIKKRNALDKQLFLNAQQVQDQGLDPEKLVWQPSGGAPHTTPAPPPPTPAPPPTTPTPSPPTPTPSPPTPTPSPPTPTPSPPTPTPSPPTPTPSPPTPTPSPPTPTPEPEGPTPTPTPSP